MHKASYVLTERLYKDPFESYFDKQHRSEACKDNRSLSDFVWL